MFGNASAPSRIYSYGCKSPHLNAEAVQDQFRMAHRYRNRLVELELARRSAVEAALRELYPNIAALDEQIAEYDQQIETLRSGIKRTNANTRSRSATADQRAELKRIREDRKPLYEQRKAARQEAFLSADWITCQSDIERRHNAACKLARAECGLYWGTYLTIEQAMQGTRKGAPPRFMPWGKANRNRRIAVQIQGGITSEQAESGEDTRLRIEPLLTGAYRTTERRKRCLVWIRIGTDDSRQPVWTCVRATIHRPIPDGAKIKWVYLQRRLVGCSDEWQVQFVISHADGFPRGDQASEGHVGIDVGWRLVPDGLRVAYWCGDDGQSGELILPLSDVGRWERSETLQSTRDRNFDVMRTQFVAWLRECTMPPDWLVERTRHLHQWRSAARLAALTIHWREHRFDGDTIYEALEAWRKQDRHLYEWQEHQRSKAIRWRDDLYRNFAADLRRRYHTAHIEDCNWQQVQKRSEPEDEESQAGAREYMRVASVGRLLQLIGESMAEVVPEPSAYTTQTCHACGELTPFDAASELRHTCDKCGVSWDQDLNAARNLLQRASGAVAVKDQ